MSSNYLHIEVALNNGFFEKARVMASISFYVCLRRVLFSYTFAELHIEYGFDWYVLVPHRLHYFQLLNQINNYNFLQQQLEPFFIFILTIHIIRLQIFFNVISVRLQIMKNSTKLQSCGIIQNLITIQQNMYDGQQISNKKAGFRCQIRRRQIEQHFYQQRIKFAEEQIKEEQQGLTKQLYSPEKKKQWIYRKAAQMGDTPHKGWFQIMRTLSIATKAFSQGDFEDWIQSGIIRCLVEVLKQQYVDLDLSKLSATVMQDIFYYLPSQSNLIELILEHQFILDLVQLCANNQTTAEYYYELIIIMMENRAYIRNLFIDNGLVQVLCTRLKNYKQSQIDSDQVFCAINLGYRLVKAYQVKGGKSLPKGNVVSVMIPILDSYLAVVKRDQTIKVLLKCFASLSQSQKQYIISHLFNSPNLIPYLLYVLQKDESPMNRSLAASIFASILSSQKTVYGEQLLRKDILTKVLMCSRRQNNTAQCISGLLRIISNLSVNSLQQAHAVVAHDILGQFVMSCANQTQNQKAHETSIYTVASLIHLQNIQITQTLLKKHNILQTLIISLRAQILSITNCQQILRSLIVLVRMYNRIFTGSHNKITLELDRMYNINTLLSMLQDKIKNQRIHAIIKVLFQAMNDVN